MADSEEDYYLPLQDQRVFGAGIKRKRINFVPASTSNSSPPLTSQNTDISSRYLSIVLPSSVSRSPNTTSTTTADISGQPPQQSSEQLSDQLSEQSNSLQTTSDLCPICDLPLSAPSSHDSSLAHQICLQHVHPPSNLPRAHIGVRYLITHGWDPDSRLGLGTRQEGITAPIKAGAKKDTSGLRERQDEEESSRKKKVDAKKQGKGQEKVVKLDAKELKKQDAAAKKRAEMLRANFYGPDLERYLGPNTS